jgi:arylsulfatase A-like enzyme
MSITTKDKKSTRREADSPVCPTSIYGPTSMKTDQRTKPTASSNQRPSAFLFGFLSLVLICGLSQAAEPNILFILADDMGWQDTSVPFAKERTKFNDRFHTPALERLAREGMKFPQAYSCAVCSPTRVSFLTGQNTPRHGVTQWTHITGDKPTPDLPHPTLSHAAWNWNGLQPVGTGLPHSVESPTLPALLKEVGYRTMHFGKGHFGAAGTPGADPKVFGFDVRIGGRDAGGCGSYSGLKNFGAKANPSGPWRAWDLDHYFGQDIHLTEALTLEAKREIRAAVADGKPFFCYFAHYAPHTPIEPDERFAPKYRASGLNETEAAYASLIRDLKQRGLLDDTIVVWAGEFGRTPMVQDVSPDGMTNAMGRDHHKDAFTVLLAGGGFKPGLTYGETDELGCRVVRDVVHVHDLQATLLHQLGLDHEQLTYRYQGRDFRLTDVHGNVVNGLLA